MQELHGFDMLAEADFRLQTIQEAMNESQDTQVFLSVAFISSEELLQAMTGFAKLHSTLLQGQALQCLYYSQSAADLL